MKPGGRYSDPIPLHQYLSTNGDGTGDTNASGDYTTPEIFFVQPGIDEIMEIDEFVLYLSDGGSLAVGNYGSLAELTNGINIIVTTAGSIAKPLIPEPIKTNGDIVHTGDGTIIHNFAAGIDDIVMTIDFKANPLLLDGSQNHKIEVMLSDNLTGLADHHFIVNGRK